MLFSYIQTEFPLKQLWASLWRAHAHLLCNCISGVRRLWIHPPWSLSFSRTSKPKFFNFSSCQVLQSSHHPHDTSLDPLQFFNVSLELGRPNWGTVFQLWPKKCQVPWDNHFPWSVGWCSPGYGLLQGQTPGSCLVFFPLGPPAPFQQILNVPSLDPQTWTAIADIEEGSCSS